MPGSTSSQFPSPSRRLRRLLLALHSLRRRGSGQTLVEFALILPLLLTVTVGVIDVGRGIATYNLLSEAARAGARAGRVTPTQAAIRDAVQRELGPLASSPSIVYGICTSNCAAHGSEDGEPFIRVTVTTTFNLVVGAVTGIVGPIPLTATSQQYLNNVVAASGAPTPAPWTPVPTPDATVVAATTATAVAQKTAVAIAELTATSTPIPYYVPPTATPTPTGQYAVPSKFVSNSDTAADYNMLVQCLVRGEATSTEITWTSDTDTTIYFWLRPSAAAGSPTVEDMKVFGQSGTTASGATLSQEVAANREYTLWVYNDGAGSDSTYDASVGSFTISCP